MSRFHYDAFAYQLYMIPLLSFAVRVGVPIQLDSITTKLVAFTSICVSAARGLSIDPI